MLLFTHRYPETYKQKFYCRRQSGMKFGQVTENGVNSNSIMTVLSDAAGTVRKIRQNENVKRNITNHNKYRKIEE